MTRGPDARAPDPVPSEPGPVAYPQEADAIAAALVAAGGGAVRGMILFGSQLSAAEPSAHSAWDVVVVVDDYRRFHRALVAAGHHRRPAWLLTALARILPPNITAFAAGGDVPLAKCAIVSAPAFERALSARARDHFLKGRMMQKVALPWARSPDDSRWVERCLARARADVLRWSGPYQEASFTVEEFALRMLRVSYRSEVRPESAGRVEAVFEAQRDFLVARYTADLRAAEADGRARRRPDGRWELTPPPGRWARLRMDLYFLRSKVRATARWAKHILTFNDWLTYIQRKVERRTGMEIELTARERRLPLLFLWPRVFQVLAARRSTGDSDSTTGRRSKR